MRWAGTCAALLAAAGCGAGSLEVSGDLADGEHADSVWHFGGNARVGVEGDSFRIAELNGDVVDLRFVDDYGLHARMEIRDAPVSALHMRGIWMADGVAHASGVRMEGGGTVTVNGIRLADPESLPREIDSEAVVLSASKGGDALLVRPVERGLPDLRVVVTPATSVTSPDGDPVDAAAVEPGDSLTVRGRTQAGYLVAAEMVVPRRSAGRSGDGGASGGRGSRSGDSGANAGGDRSGEASGGDARGNRGRGKGKGRGRGRGRGNR